ncbi:ATP-binding protein [Zoogloea sp.]|uniref:ATP-binding protein n=1 Tax=Zoogloea sp. TaxID=49181 RepID=UPI001416A639|nr:MAG: ATP-binding protein [Zoogloea sp.]
MVKENLFEQSLRKVRQQPKWKPIVALRAAVEPSEVEELISKGDERVVNAVLSMTGRGGSIRAVDISSKKFIEKILRAAAWDKRMYAVFGPTGVGKTFAINSVVPNIEGTKVSYVRVNEYNKGNKIALLQQIYRGFGFNSVESLKGFRSLHGNPYFHKLRERFETENAVIIIDEAQKLRDNSFEMLRDLYDETKVSLVIIGSTAFAEKLATKKIGDEVFGQMLRRFDDRYELPHATAVDVKLFLAAYGITIDAAEAKQIARKISTWGDIDTLAKAMRFIAGDVEDGELTWTKVGAGNIIDAVERVIMLMDIKADNGSEDK